MWVAPTPAPVEGPLSGADRPILEAFLLWERATLTNICAELTGGFQQRQWDRCSGHDKERAGSVDRIGDCLDILNGTEEVLQGIPAFDFSPIDFGGEVDLIHRFHQLYAL